MQLLNLKSSKKTKIDTINLNLRSEKLFPKQKPKNVSFKQTNDENSIILANPKQVNLKKNQKRMGQNQMFVSKQSFTNLGTFGLQQRNPNISGSQSDMKTPRNSKKSASVEKSKSSLTKTNSLLKPQSKPFKSQIFNRGPLKFLNRTNFTSELSRFSDIVASIPKSEDISVSSSDKRRIQLVVNFFNERFGAVIQKMNRKRPTNAEEKKQILACESNCSLEEVVLSRAKPSPPLERFDNQTEICLSFCFTKDLIDCGEHCLGTSTELKEARKAQLVVSQRNNTVDAICESKGNHLECTPSFKLKEKMARTDINQNKLGGQGEMVREAHLANGLPKSVSEKLTKKVINFSKMVFKTSNYYEESFDKSNFNKLFFKIIQERQMDCLIEIKSKFLELRRIFRDLTKVFAKVSRRILQQVLTLSDLRIDLQNFRKQTLFLIHSIMTDFMIRHNAPNESKQNHATKLRKSL